MVQIGLALSECRRVDMVVYVNFRHVEIVVEGFDIRLVNWGCCEGNMHHHGE